MCPLVLRDPVGVDHTCKYQGSIYFQWFEMMLRIVLLTLMAVAALAEIDLSPKVIGKCSSDNDKVEDIKEAIEGLQTSLTDAAKSSYDDLVRAFQTKNFEDGVFKGMCDVAPDVVVDIANVAELMGSCYDPEHQGEIDAAIDSLEGIIVDTAEYLCEDDGDKIIQFLKEGGLECLESKSAVLDKCVDFDPETTKVQQDVTDTMKTCFVNAMKGCPSSVPAEILEAWYMKIRNNIPTAAERKSGVKKSKVSAEKKAAKKKKGASAADTISRPMSICALPIIYFIASFVN